MNLKKIFFFLISCAILNSCADYNSKLNKNKKEKQYYSSSGFALIYEEALFKDKTINKKINNDKIVLLHSSLKINTPIKIINPVNSRFIESKIYRNAKFPKIFNVVISKKIASELVLDFNNPYVEVIEIKKNKTFIAKKANTYEEEKNVAEKAPVDAIETDNLSSAQTTSENNTSKKINYSIIINDFYYKDSAKSLKVDLVKKTKLNNIYIKKINDKKYRLLVGPFKNFNALKTAYISLNNLSFENLNIYND